MSNTQSPISNIRERIARFLFGGVIDRLVNAAVSVRVDDSAGWDPLSGGGPADRPWSELREDLTDALDAWRHNFMIRRIVTLVRSYVVGNGITISSQRRDVDKFIREFWIHPKNRMAQRLGPMCDELTRAGELFVVLHTNKVDGMSYVRLVPATQIREIKCDGDDYEKELAYGEIQPTTADLKWWPSPEDPDAFQKTDAGRLPPVMIHFTVNKPVGATRGEGDLVPILKWALRYSNWLADRVKLNRIRTRAAMLDVQIADDSQVEAKKHQYQRKDPLAAGILVHGPGEEVNLHNLQIAADEVADDGKALRLAIATGANTGLHYLGEGQSTNYATAKEMGEPTARFHTERQDTLTQILYDIITIAYHRRLVITERALPAYWREDLALQASVLEVARADNLQLAQAANQITAALAEMALHGWIDDRTAIKLAFKFAGETIGEEEINSILESGVTQWTIKQKDHNHIESHTPLVTSISPNRDNGNTK